MENKDAKPFPRLKEQPFDFFIVLDFEATCNENKNRGMTQEIIEFPSVLIDAKSLQVVGEFHFYVKPVLHPELTAFCTELTGITQERVDKGAAFPEILHRYRAWLEKKGLLDETGRRKSFTFVTCGDWDLKTMISVQCAASKLAVPTYFSTWVNIKQVYADFYKRKPSGMVEMLNGLKLSLDGRHHSGIDDCRNISKILVRILQDGAVIKETWTSTPPSKRY